jgi:hypothetical protein
MLESCSEASVVCSLSAPEGVLLTVRRPKYRDHDIVCMFMSSIASRTTILRITCVPPSIRMWCKTVTALGIGRIPQVPRITPVRRLTNY